MKKVIYLLFAFLCLVTTHSVFGQTTYNIDQSGVANLQFNSPIDITIAEDDISYPISIGFNFTFFGNTYTDFYIDQNGFITFDSNPWSSWEAQYIPDGNPPNNLIAAIWTDLDSYDTYYSYETDGPPGNQKLYVTFDGYSFCGQYLYAQIVLWESDNRIEIHTSNWDPGIIFLQDGTNTSQNANNCPAFATQGIEDEFGTNAFYVPGRNQDDQFLLFNDYVAFIPALDNDAGVVGNISVYCDGLQDIQTVITNAGANTIDSVLVNWTWNGVAQPPVQYNFAISPGTNVLVTLGQQNLTFGMPDTLSVTTSNPNGMTDPNPSNNSVTTEINVGLNGTYTIGSGEDYETFTAAVSALQSTGMCDSVIFNVKEGAYFEQFTIPWINGAFNDNQIIFQADPTNNGPVLVVHQATGFSTNHVVQFDGARNVTFKNIKFQNSGTSYGRVWDIRNGSRELEFINDTLIGKEFPANNVNFALAHLNTDQNDFLFEGNHFIYGSYGIYQESSLIPATNSNTIIRNNLFDNFRYYGVRLYNHESPQIFDNQFISPNNTTEIGIALDQTIGDSMRIERNTFYLNGATYGISIGNSNFTGQSRVANNAIYIDGFGNDIGINLNNVDSLGVYFNSVYMRGSDEDATALNLAGSTNLYIQNNIFYNGNAGLAIITDQIDPGTNMDYNNLRSEGQFLNRLSSGSDVGFGDLASWQSTSGWETNGVSIDPLFVDTFDLHTQQVLLNKRAVPIAGIGEDFEGDLRGGAPDIGADEFAPGMNDLGVLEFIGPTTSCNTTQDVIVKVQNAGSNLVNSYTLNWAVDGVLQTPAMQSNPLDTLGGFGINEEIVNLGSYSFSDGTTYEIKAWTSAPNGMVDPNNLNDTILLIYQLPLNGTYTIGTAPSDFLTIEDAIRTLDTAGMCGPVRLEFKPGIYDQHVIINPINGASETNRLTITSQSGDTSDTKIQYIVPVLDNEEAIFQLEGADYITFSNLGLYVDGNFYHRHIWLNGNTQSIRVEGNHFLGRSNITGGGETIYGISKTGDIDLVIENNHFIGSSHGVYLRGLNQNDRFSNVTIQGNTFEDHNVRFIDLAFVNDLIIEGNQLSRNIDNGSSPLSIFVQYCDGQSVISNNNIISTTNLNGMLLQFFNQQLPGSKVRVFNNMVSTINAGYCFSFSNSYNLECYYNNFYNTRLNSFSYAFRSSSSDTLDIRNNIFYAEQGAAMSIAFATNSINSDHNNILSNGSTQVSSWMGSYTTLTDWQNASGQDINSLAVDPQYFSATDLHIQQVLLDQQGTPIPGITTDFDGGVRDPVAPDIGADEVFGNNLDISIVGLIPEMPFASGLQNVKAIVYNFGTDSIAQMNLDWSLNGVGQTQFNFAGLIPSNTFDTITIGQANFGFNQAYDIVAYTSAPNGMTDQNLGNDTISVQNLYPAVNGVLTIAGTSPDFSDVFQAIEAMENGGVMGGVMFNIRSGTYTDSLIFPQTDYYSCESPVIFQSESGDPADVIFQNTNETAYPLHLSGADGLIFKNMTFRTVSTTYPNAVRIEGQSHCNAFDGCVLEGLSTTSTSVTQAAVYSPGDRDTSNLFTNNQFINGSYGLAFSGASSSTREENNQLVGNEFIDQYYRAVYFNYNKRPIVTGNTFSSNTSYNGYTGILLFRTDGPFNVSSNLMNLSNVNGTGININIVGGLASNRSLLSNNMVQIGNGPSQFSTGIYLYATANVLVAHNSVWTGGSNNNTRAFYSRQNTANSIDLLNNNFVNDANGEAMLFWLDTDVNLSDRNNLQSNGNLVYRGGSNYADLPAWQVTGFDSNSYEEDPGFVGPDDLHVQSAFLNGTATPLPQVPLDIDGQIRDTLTPDIGADEFGLFSDDVGILSINYPVQPFPSGLQTIFIKFSNNGVDTLTSMQVDFTVNGDTLQTYQWTGLLPSSVTYDSLDIATYDFLPDSIYKIKVWVSNPNGMTDGLASNDTLEVTGLYPGLLGTYTIGGTNSDFETISEAVDVLNLGGAAGPVTFNILSGVYDEPIHLTQFPGSSCENPVVFQSQNLDSTSVTIRNLGIDEYPVYLDGADGVTFQHLTIETVNPSYANAIRIGNGSGGTHCNTIQHTEVLGYVINSTSSNYAAILDANGTDHSNVYQYNYISGGSHALHLTHSGNAQSGTKVIGNVFENQYFRGLYAINHNGIEVKSNMITSISAYSGLQGIYLSACDSAVTVVKNQILNPTGQYGMLIYDVDATSTNPARIENNFVSIGRDAICYGIEIGNCRFVSVYHNNVSNRSDRASYAANNTAIRINNGDSLDIRNNIFAGIGSQTNAIESFNSPSYIALDYNNYYSASSFIGYWENANVTDLTAWQVASSDDVNSLSSNPEFASDLDLHVGLVLLNGAGDPTLGVSDDNDGDLRGTPPDIGADEFDPAASDDAGVFAFMGPIAPFADGIQNVQFAIKNFGGNALTSADVRWLVNGIEQTPYTWSGNLSPGECDTVTIGAFDFLPYQKHDFVIWTEQPNGVPDSTLVNDTLYLENLYPALNGSYTVGGVLPDFNLFSQLQDALNLGGIIGDVDFQIRPGSYEEQIAIGYFPRTNPAHFVLFESESGSAADVTLVRNFSGDNYTILLDEAREITFRNLSLESTLGNVVVLSNGSKNITLDSVIISGVENSFGSSKALVYSGTSSESGFTLTNSILNDGSYGVYISASRGAPEFNTVISNNVFNSQEYMGLYAANQSGIQISGNQVFVLDESQNYGFYLDECGDSLTISNNRILMSSNGYGMWIEGSAMTSSGFGQVYNNYINIGGTVKSEGIHLRTSPRINFSFNSVHITNTHENSYAMHMYSSSSVQTNIQNNIFANLGGGMSFYSFYTSPFNNFNYNDFYTTGPDLIRVGLIFQTLLDLQINTSKNLNSLSVDPIFLDEEFPEVAQVQLDGAATPISGITGDIQGDVRNGTTPDIGADEFTPVANDIAVVELVSPMTFCGLSANEDVTIRLQNRGSSAQTGFNVSFMLNGSMVTQNIGGLNVPAGGTADFTFSMQVDLSVVGLYDFKVISSLIGDSRTENDTLLQEVEHIPQLLDPVTNMLPLDNAIDVNKPLSLSWGPAPNATLYDIYIWPSSESQPGTPQITNKAQINTSYNTSINYGETYNWQVVAKNVCDQMVPGPIQTFTVRDLPDLVVDTVIVPSTAFSGQEIQVEWVVKNIGSGETGPQLWTDAIYLSSDATLNLSTDTYLGGVQNLTALQSGIGYTNTAVVNLPISIVGNYYLFVSSDRYNNLLESNNQNNVERSQTQIAVFQPPSPDLKTVQVSPPQSAFSGEQITIIYEVKNIGTGTTGETTWKDRVVLSTDPQNSIGIFLNQEQISMELLPDSTYQNTVVATLPEGIFGIFYIWIESDELDNIYENFAEENNVMRSDTMTVILSPPSDLVIDTLVLPDTVSSGERHQLSYTVSNQGGGDTEANYWYDNVYISISPIFNDNFNQRISSIYHSTTVPSLGQYQKNVQVTIPKEEEGLYYLYGVTDVSDREFEFDMEDNNLYEHGTQIFIANADLRLQNLVYPDTVIGESLYPYSIELINPGLGSFANKYVRTNIYVSNDSMFNVDQAVFLGSVGSNVQLTMASGDTTAYSFSLTLPSSVSGEAYVHYVADATNQVFEGVNEANNTVTISSPIFVQEGNVPDLIVESLTIPDTVQSGLNTLISYVTKNQGNLTFHENWVDDVYISFDSIWNPMNALELLERPQSVDLNPDSTWETTLGIILDPSTTENFYYIYVLSDFEDDMYESVAGEQNNIFRSNAFFVLDAPDVDLAIDTLTLISGPYNSGGFYSAQWTTSIVNGATPVVPIWRDDIYLSADQSLDTLVDIKIGSFGVNGVLQGLSPSNPLTQSGLVQIPNGLFGQFYVIAVSDVIHNVLDTNRPNNEELVRDGAGSPVQIQINLAPYPDLQISQFVAPDQTVAGQPTQIDISIVNNGNANAGTWRNRIYLSTDEVRGNGDLLLENQEYDFLNMGDTLSETYTPDIPIQYLGNYFLICVIDQEDNVYEYQGESNNEVTRTIEITVPPPSDLEVVAIVVPVEGVAGDSAIVSWTTENVGSFPASGQFREIVYLSPDTTWDVSDPIFGVIDDNLYLPPLAQKNIDFKAPIRDVAVGDYYAIVQTDARDNFSESDEDNNYTSSLSPIDVDVKTLQFDSLTLDTLINVVELYYKIEVTPLELDETMIISLDGDSLNGLNELYVKFEGIPSRSDFDVAFDVPFSGDQRVIVPNLEVGTYYIMGYGVSTAAAQQEVELLARIVPFEILSIAPMMGVKDQKVTVEIKGVKLTSTDQYRLRISDPWFALYAESIYEFSDNLIYVTFDLTDVPVDTYSIEGIRPDSNMALVENGFMVIENGGPDMQIQVHAPGTMPRRVVPVKLTINFTNAGKADAIDPKVTVIAPYGNIMAPSIEALRNQEGASELEISLKEENGPEGLVRPRGSGVIELYSWSSPLPVFVVGIKDPE